MDPVSPADMVLFERFRFNRRGGGLFRLDDGAQVAVGSRALDVLSVLIERAGDLVSKDEIMRAVWPGTAVEDANLTMQISALRRVLDLERSEGSCIQTVAMRGYRFIGEVTQNNLDARSGIERREKRSPHTPPRLSIVVLPFANLNDDPEQQFFADAITEDLTTDLSGISGMLVISRNTAFTYQGRRIDTRQIGRELGVRYVLEGSVRRSGDHIRINAQLIDAQTDTHLWTERFDRGITDLFALQDEVVRRIAVTLNLELLTIEACHTTSNPDALDYILRGRSVMSQPRTPGSYTESISLFERALALDPRSSEAQSRLATFLSARVMDNMTGSHASDIARAEVLAEQALASSPRSHLAHMAKGQVLRAQGRYAEAIPEYETALAINRNWAPALRHIGQCKLFSGFPEKTIPLVEQAIALSPRDPQISTFLSEIGRVHLLQSRADEAILWLERARNASSAHPAVRAFLASAYALNGETQRAATELTEARRLSSDDRFSSVARLKAVQYWGVPKVRALFEATYFIGLRKAGMPEE
jgi:TolB-like protein/Tfp pilus assembly protein PilF